MDLKKRPIVVRTISLPSSTCSTLSGLDEKHSLPGYTPKGQITHDGRTEEPAEPTTFAKGKELLAFASGYLFTYARDMPRPHKAVSKQGDFHHYVVEPWYGWFGRNKRVTTSPALSTITLQPCQQRLERPMINGGGFNYAGTYSMSTEYEALHRKCLDQLPVDGAAAPMIEQALQKAVAKFWDAECCLTTPTGYQSNILALTAILDDSWCLLMDHKSHSSISMAAYLADVGCRKKFKHNSMQDLERFLVQYGGKYVNVMVAIEGLYSLDGDIPDLAALHALKSRYGFTVLCDEAHSFLSLGKTGHGCVEWWNDIHPDNPVPTDLIDIRTTTLSKAVGGGIGGLVCATERFSAQLHSRASKLNEAGESISVPTMIQLLWVLHQPRRLERNLSRVRAMSVFCHQELENAGVYVYGERNSPVLPVHAGRPTKASKLSCMLRKHGVVATPFSKPAVPMWQSRVRIGMSAEFSDEHVNRLVDALIDACEETRVLRPRKPKPTHDKALFRSHTSDAGLDTEQCDALRYLHDLLQAQSDTLAIAVSPISEGSAHFYEGCAHPASQPPSAVVEAGHQGRALYGLASGSSRWILGTYPPHLEVEILICEMTGQPAAMLYPNTEVGLTSTVAALCRPIKHCQAHWLLVPETVQQPVLDGYRTAPRNSETMMVRYDGLNDLSTVVCSLGGRKDKGYITLILDSRKVAIKYDDEIDGIFGRLSEFRRQFHGMTILFDSTFGRPSLDPVSKQVMSDVQDLAARLQARLLIFTSFYHTLGLNGACLAGDEALIEELRYTSRCYVFTAAPAPYMMAMVAEALNVSGAEPKPRFSDGAVW